MTPVVQLDAYFTAKVNRNAARTQIVAALGNPIFVERSDTDDLDRKPGIAGRAGYATEAEAEIAYNNLKNLLVQTSAAQGTISRHLCSHDDAVMSPCVFQEEFTK